MDMSPTRKLCQNLIASAIRRCCISDNLCRLSVIVKTFSEFDPPSTRIAISDTGVGSCLSEFQNADYAKDPISTKNWASDHVTSALVLGLGFIGQLIATTNKKCLNSMLVLSVSVPVLKYALDNAHHKLWSGNESFLFDADGVLSITTTSTTDIEVYHYRLNLQETLTKKKLTRLPSTPKRGRNFSGTEVSLTTHEDIVKWITCFCQKIAVVKIPKVTVELVVEHMNNSGARFERHLQANDGILLPSSLSNIERLARGLEEFVLRHGNALHKEHQDCFFSRENLKIGIGTDSGEVSKSTMQTMEAVVVIKGPKLSNPPSMVADGASTEVLFFHNFSPCSISQSCLHGLISIDWQNYGLTFRDFFMDGDGNAVLRWEALPFDHIYIALHSYNIKYPEVDYMFSSYSITCWKFTMVQTQQRNLEDKKLVRKAVKLALDDLKVKYPGFLLSRNALKIQKHAPDLSKAIAGLILSSNDLGFQAECASLLGLDNLDINKQSKIETCITDKLLGIIAMTDCKSSRGKPHAPLLFDDNASQKDEFQDEGDDG